MRIMSIFRTGFSGILVIALLFLLLSPHIGDCQEHKTKTPATRRTPQPKETGPDARPGREGPAEPALSGHPGGTPSGKKQNPAKGRGPEELGEMGRDAAATKRPPAQSIPTEEDSEEDASGPKYEEITPDESLKKFSSEVGEILRNGTMTAAQQQTLNDYFTKYFLPQWTQVKNIGDLHTYRKQLRTSYLGRKTMGDQYQVHDYLNMVVLDFMKKLVSGNYHPAVRVNAMLMIGELNRVEQPPAPLPEALVFLRESVANSGMSDALRAAAMIGIQRHISLGISEQEARTRLVTTLLNIANEDVPEGPAKAGREWMLCLAIESLASFGAVGEQNAVFNAILKAANNKNLSLSTRAIALNSLGQLNYTGASGIDPTAAAASVGRFIIDACEEEKRLAEEKHSLSATANPPPAVRRMRQRLGAAMTALTGTGADNRKGIVSLAKAPAQQAYIAKLQKDMQEMITRIEKRRDDEDLKDEFENLRKKLEDTLKANS